MSHKNKKINILCAREGRDSFEEVYPSTLDEWKELSGKTRPDEILASDVFDSDLLDEIMARPEVSTTQDERDSIEYVVLFF